MKKWKDLVVTPIETVWKYNEWHEHDEKVGELLGFALSIEQRYVECFPERKLPLPYYFSMEDNHLLADAAPLARASCALLTYDKKDAYLSKLCAYPMHQGHGKRFLEKVQNMLRSQKVERVWLFTDRGSHVGGFYEKLGYKMVNEKEGVPPSIWSIRYEDNLYCLVLC